MGLRPALANPELPSSVGRPWIGGSTLRNEHLEVKRASRWASLQPHDRPRNRNDRRCITYGQEGRHYSLDEDLIIDSDGGKAALKNPPNEENRRALAVSGLLAEVRWRVSCGDPADRRATLVLLDVLPLLIFGVDDERGRADQSAALTVMESAYRDYDQQIDCADPIVAERRLVAAIEELRSHALPTKSSERPSLGAP